MKPQRHTLVVEVLSDVDKGQRQMQARLHDWLETYGHTSVSFGFEFKTVGVLTGKHVNPKGRNPHAPSK